MTRFPHYFLIRDIIFHFTTPIVLISVFFFSFLIIFHVMTVTLCVCVFESGNISPISTFFFFLVFLSVCGSFYLNVSHFLIIGFFIVCPLSEKGVGVK